jgi:hypothetical protein
MSSPSQHQLQRPVSALSVVHKQLDLVSGGAASGTGGAEFFHTGQIFVDSDNEGASMCLRRVETQVSCRCCLLLLLLCCDVLLHVVVILS